VFTRIINHCVTVFVTERDFPSEEG